MRWLSLLCFLRSTCAIYPKSVVAYGSICTYLSCCKKTFSLLFLPLTWQYLRGIFNRLSARRSASKLILSAGLQDELVLNGNALLECC